MDCNCLTNVANYDIELIQGDYGSYLYVITNQDGTPLKDVENVVFTCSRLKQQLNLSVLSETEFSLTLDSELTSTFSACTCTYDITILFKGEQTPITVVHNATFVILKKENKLNGNGE